MRKSSLVTSLVFLFLSGTYTTAFAQEAGQTDRAGDDFTMIEVGAGAGTTLGRADDAPAVEILFKVEAVRGTKFEGGALVWGRIDGDFGVASDAAELSYADIEFNGPGYAMYEKGLPVAAHGYLGHVEYQRDFSIGLDHMVRISVLGLKVAYDIGITEKTRFLVGAAGDLLGYSYTRRISDGAESDGFSGGFSAYTGVARSGKWGYRIVTGGEWTSVNSKPEHFRDPNYYNCQCDYYDTYCDGYGSGYNRQCRDAYITEYQDQRSFGRYYVKYLQSLGSRLSVYAQGRYQVYEVRDLSDEVADSSERSLRLILGGSYRF